MVRRARAIAAVALLAATGAFSACGNSSTAPSPSPIRISITGAVPKLFGQTSQLAAIATFADGTIQDATRQAMWSSSNTAVATVTSGGLLTVLGFGSTEITATSAGMSGKLPVVVSPSMSVIGTVPDLFGQTSQLTAIAMLADGTAQDVTTHATWSSSNTTVATVTSGGLLKMLGFGSTEITATYQGLSGRLPIVMQP